MQKRVDGAEVDAIRCCEILTSAQLVTFLEPVRLVVRVDQAGLRPAQDMSGRDAAAGIGEGNDARRAELEHFPVVVGVGDLVQVLITSIAHDPTQNPSFFIVII